jgi:aminopeptidase N
VIGTYHVALEAPRQLRLATTGAMVGHEREAGGYVRRRFLAEKVRDFAWAAGPFSQLTGTTAEGVRVRVSWLAPLTPADAQRSLDWALMAMPRYTQLFGTYPYSEVDVVLSPFTGFGGMEYPTLVMTVPAEHAVVHELAHQWWYGIVGDDEYGAPWLDEAFASYAEDLVTGSLDGLCTNLNQWGRDDARITNPMSYWVQHPEIYSLVVYQHGACSLWTLRQALGGPRFDAMLHAYADSHRFGFSTTADFQAAADAAAAQASPPVDLTSFWTSQRIG